MKLNKRYFRSIRENLSFYISSTVLTVVTLLMFFMYNITGNAILDFSNGFYAKHHLSDAEFSTYQSISEKDIDRMEKKYDLVMERESFINVKTDDLTVRIFRPTEKLNTYEVTVGKDATDGNDIVLSEGYARQKNIHPGDTLTLGNRKYTVTGFIQRPDYLYMLENKTDSYKNVTTFCLGYVTQDEFEKLGRCEEKYYVLYNDRNNIASFRKELNDTYFVSEYTSRDDNPRINMVVRQADLFVMFSYIFLCVLPLISVSLIAIIISRKVKSEQRLIGTLSALGYTKRRITMHYVTFAAIPGIIGGVLTTLISLFTAQPYAEAGLMDYEPMRVVGHLDGITMFLGILVPTFMYIAAAALTLRRLLKKDTVDLLHATAAGETRALHKIFVKKDFAVRIKYALRSLLANPARSFVVFLGIFLGAFITLCGNGMLDSMKYTSEHVMDMSGNFKYEYILNDLEDENIYGGESLLLCPIEDDRQRSMLLIGTDADNKYIDLYDENGGRVSVEDGYYISTLIKTAYGLEKGDSLYIVNPISLKQEKIKIAGVVQNNVQKAIYTTKHRSTEFMGVKETVFNALISNSPLSIPKERISQEITGESTKEQVDTMISQVGSVFFLVKLLGCIICISAVYVAVNMLLEESAPTISMLKVLGYSDRDINRSILNIHHILLIPGLLLSIPLAYMLLRGMFLLMVDYGVMLMTEYISLQSYIESFSLTILSYLASLFFLRRKIRKVDMIESLKDNRE